MEGPKDSWLAIGVGFTVLSCIGLMIVLATRPSVPLPASTPTVQQVPPQGELSFGAPALRPQRMMRYASNDQVTVYELRGPHDEQCLIAVDSTCCSVRAMAMSCTAHKSAEGGAK